MPLAVVSPSGRAFHHGQPRSATSPLPARPSSEVCTPDKLNQAQLPPSMSTMTTSWCPLRRWGAGTREGRKP